MEICNMLNMLDIFFADLVLPLSGRIAAKDENGFERTQII